MRDIELYRHLLGIDSPWTVTRVELNVPDQRVDVWAGHEERAAWRCPECATTAPLYDHAEERVWRHLDSCQFRTLLHARPPRVQRPTHGVRCAHGSYAATSDKGGLCQVPRALSRAATTLHPVHDAYAPARTRSRTAGR